MTPSHFLIGRRVLSIPYGAGIDKNDPEFDVSPVDLTRRMSHLNGLLNQFWKRWKSEYLLELQDCHRYNTGNPNARPVAIRDVVLVHDNLDVYGDWLRWLRVRTSRTIALPSGD